jgi:hypothetical protein
MRHYTGICRKIPTYAAPYRRYGADVETDVEKFLPYAALYRR